MNKQYSTTLNKVESDALVDICVHHNLRYAPMLRQLVVEEKRRIEREREPPVKKRYGMVDKTLDLFR